MRLFAAVEAGEAGEAARAAIAEAQGELRRAGGDVCWTEPGKWHVTVKFLGETAVAMLPAISAACREIAADSPGGAAELAAAGTFGGKAPRVVWIGLSDRAGVLARLAATAEDMFARAGLPRDSRPFRAHVTIGRVRSTRGARALLDAVKTVRVRPESFRVDSLVLLHSRPTSAGSVYEPLERVMLAPPPLSGGLPARFLPLPVVPR